MEQANQEKIESLRAEAAELLRDVSALLQAERSGLDFLTLCTAVTIKFLEFTETVKAAEFTPVEAMVWHEIANAAAQISFHTLEIQSADEEGIVSHLRDTAQHAAYIHKAAKLPGEAVYQVRLRNTEEPEIAAEPETEAEPLALQAGTQALSVFEAEDTVERLKREVRELREELISLEMEKDELENEEKKTLEAEYTLKLGGLLSELYKLQTDLRYIQRKIELTRAAWKAKELAEERERQRAEDREKAKEARQAQADRPWKKPGVNIPKDVEEQLEKEYQNYQEKFAEYIKKKKEAEEYLRKHARKTDAGSTGETIHEFMRHGRDSSGQEEDKKEQPGGQSQKKENAAGAGSKEGPGAGKDRAQAAPPVKDAAYLKNLYRKIVKAMHPDQHPNQSEREKELFKKAIAAYHDGDLETLEKIYSMIENEPAPNDSEATTIEKLIREKQRLLLIIRQTQASIKNILSRFPFTERETLRDPEKLSAQQAEIRRRTETVKQQIEEYTKYYDEMVRKYEEKENGKQDG